MICPHCGFENTDTAKFCNECGYKLQKLTIPPVSDIQQTEESLPEEETAASSIDNVALSPLNDEELPEFDFSPYDGDDTEGHDLSPEETGRVVPVSALPKDEPTESALIGSSYVPPRSKWKTGDTMEMPRVEEDAPRKQREFKAPEETREKKSGKKAAIIVTILVIIAALATAGLTYYFEVWGGKVIPDVVGMDQARASELLEEKGFLVKVMKVKSDDTENSVLLMDPGSNKRADEGSEIILHVATPRFVPELVGKSFEEAESFLSQEGLVKVEFLKRKSDDEPNIVLSVEPEAGTEVTANTQVKVTISEPFIVPDTLGMGEASARDLLYEEGYTAYVLYVYSEATEGTVIASDPTPGTRFESGSSVTLQIAKSRAQELIENTQYYFSVGASLSANGVNYEVRSFNNPTYIGNGSTQVVASVAPYTTLLDERVYGSVRQVTFTFAWNSSNELISISAT